MGLLNDYFKAKIYGNEVRKIIKEAKGKSEQEQAMDIILKAKKEGICEHCGAHVGEKEIKGQCQRVWICGAWLCKKCVKICKECGKIFCPKHINNHKCK